MLPSIGVILYPFCKYHKRELLDLLKLNELAVMAQLLDFHTWNIKCVSRSAEDMAQKVRESATEPLCCQMSLLQLDVIVADTPQTTGCEEWDEQVAQQLVPAMGNTR